jgi:hypothetical protein
MPQEAAIAIGALDWVRKPDEEPVAWPLPREGEEAG